MLDQELFIILVLDVWQNIECDIECGQLAANVDAAPAGGTLISELGHGMLQLLMA